MGIKEICLFDGNHKIISFVFLLNRKDNIRYDRRMFNIWKPMAFINYKPTIFECQHKKSKAHQL